MVNSINSGEKRKREENQQQHKHFSYQSNKSQASGGWDKIDNSENITPSYIREKLNSQKNWHSSSNKSKVIQGFDLDSVWSIRNNVSVSKSSKPLQMKNSFYSRYQQQGSNSTATNKVSIGSTVPSIKTLEKKLPLSKNTDDTREMSARTSRAARYHNAYLRSNGLGHYAPTANEYSFSPKPSDYNDDRDF